eukprot:GEMP01068928.1.p1 GENE.GEMP01068928.1~~GEMP01068928.1.p1  ORF type:complete len:253 (+),score=25.96 GEMP01068928.1:169-927(+)
MPVLVSALANDAHEPHMTPGFSDFRMPGHLNEADVQIGGSECQALHMMVKPGQKVMCEAGAMIHKGQFLEMGVTQGSNCCARACCAGEGCCYTTFENKGQIPQVLGLTPNYNAKVLPIDLNRESGLFIKNKTYFAHDTGDLGWEFSFAGLAKCCCGGQGCCLAQVHGTGNLYLNAGGTIYQKVLQDGEKIRVDTEAVVAYSKTVKYELECLSVYVCCFAGEGFTNTVLTGPGMIILQTMSLDKLKHGILHHA